MTYSLYADSVNFNINLGSRMYPNSENNYDKSWIYAECTLTAPNLKIIQAFNMQTFDLLNSVDIDNQNNFFLDTLEKQFSLEGISLSSGVEWHLMLMNDVQHKYKFEIEFVTDSMQLEKFKKCIKSFLHEIC
ncbi:hypothetical protein IPJ91_03175 [bacterium]|nr:MAG: hypothetical protein IPJ91_03175 [bacterium]